MPIVNLKNGEAEPIDIGNSEGILATNVSNEDAKFYVDYLDGKVWKPITGEVTLKPGKARGWTRVELGHDHIRVGARGKDDGTTIVRVDY